MYAIEKNIPMPQRTGRTAAMYPFHEMAIGDSFIVPPNKGVSARSCSQSYAKRHVGVKFTSRKMSVGTSTGVRIWRTA